MLVDAIFIALFLLTWSVLGTLAWIALSLRRRAVGALFALPIALVGAIGGGAATPLLGLDDGAGSASACSRRCSAARCSASWPSPPGTCWSWAASFDRSPDANTAQNGTAR